jgi:DNA-binding NarL/FixJ family response regulator
MRAAAAKRVLVVDGDAIACAGWRAVLGAQPWVASCEATVDLDECMSQAALMEPQIALVGLTLDKHHGAEVCLRLHMKHSAMRLILVCDTEALPVQAARAAGASGLVHRCWTLDTILDVVHRVGQGETMLAGAAVKAAGSRRLSRRELSVLRMVACGASNPEIAAALHLSRHTVKEYTQTVFRKLGVRNRVEAATTAARLGYAE